MSMYFPEKQALFLHIQRTAGGWIKDAAKALGMKGTRLLRHPPHTVQYNHRPLAYYAKEQYSYWRPRKYLTDNSKLNKFRFKFVWTQVRHPIPYYESVWGWLTIMPEWARQRLTYRWTWDSLMRPAQLYDPDFNVWVERMLEDQGAWITRLFWLFAGPPGGEFCQYIGRTQTTMQDFIEVMQLIGYAAEVEGKRQALETLERKDESRSSRPPIEWRKDLLNQMLHEERLVISRWFDDKTLHMRRYAELDPDWRVNNRRVLKRGYQGV